MPHTLTTFRSIALALGTSSCLADQVFSPSLQEAPHRAAAYAKVLCSAGLIHILGLVD